MMRRMLTPAQARALLWLTGEWQTVNASISSAVESLCLYHKDLTERRNGPHGPRGGYCRQTRLSKKGLAVKSEQGARTMSNQTMSDGQRWYRAAIYFGVATMHFYRDDILPLTPQQTLGDFADANDAVIQRVFKETLEYLNYELSHEQVGRMLAAYVAEPVSLASDFRPIGEAVDRIVARVRPNGNAG